jgi:hypothetical protein
MKTRNVLKVLTVSAMATVVTTASAQTILDPTALGIKPFRDIATASASAILYLDSNCQVVAFIAPPPGDPGHFIPTAKDIDDNWQKRRPKYSPPGTPCPAIPTPMPAPPTNATTTINFLDTTLVSAGNPDSCRPNVSLNAVGAEICSINPAQIHTTIVVDDTFRPLAVMEGTFTSGNLSQIPAASLVRTKFGGIAPCSPSTPNPCPPGTTAQAVWVGKWVCMCQ